MFGLQGFFIHFKSSFHTLSWQKKDRWKLDLLIVHHLFGATEPSLKILIKKKKQRKRNKFAHKVGKIYKIQYLKRAVVSTSGS